MSQTNGSGEFMASSPFEKNASYYVEYTEDGVFFVAEYEDVGGRPIQQEVFLQDIRRRNIQGLDEAVLWLKIQRHETRILIADPQEEADAPADEAVIVARNEMSAELVLLPPCGKGSEKSAEEVLASIRDKWGIVFGVDEKVVTDAVNAREYNEYIVVAHGKPAEKGEDAVMTFLFETEHNYAPKISDDGNADYKTLNIFESVKEGTTVVVCTPPGEGIEGTTVKGTPLPPKRGADLKLPVGKNVRISEDGRSLIAEKSGRIDYIRGRVDISDVFQVNGDVDMSVGNLDFVGDVLIFGNVISGLTVKATGLIEVRGYVEAATLTAGKDIILKNGMQGMDKGILNAGGNIVAKFLERCEIHAQGNITSDYIIQCKVTACGAITMKGKYGKILGGVVRAGSSITANTIGSPSNELTVLELGASPDLRVKCMKLTEEKNQIRIQLDKINNVQRVFEARGDNASAERQEMREKLIGAKGQLENKLEEIAAEIEELTATLDSQTDAKVHIFKSIFPNVKITIDSSATVTKGKVDYATFKRHGGEVTFTACEAR